MGTLVKLSKDDAIRNVKWNGMNIYFNGISQWFWEIQSKESADLFLERKHRTWC